MVRAQSSDMRERVGLTAILIAYYETHPVIRGDFLSVIESKLGDVREGVLTPFAASPLLVCLAQGMELGFEGHELLKCFAACFVSVSE
jgi:hypothetical protein